MPEFSHGTMTQFWSRLMLVVATLAVVFGFSGSADAHFSYSDPRVIHLAENGKDQSVILIRMPGPLALLPADWQGSKDVRTPPFTVIFVGETILDTAALIQGDAALRERLNKAVTLNVAGQRVQTRVEQYRFWTDDARPRFGTLKSALAAFDAPLDLTGTQRLPYYDLTLDVMISVPVSDLSAELQLDSNLGHRFQATDKFGTVIKLHRNDTTETKAAMGVLEVSFPKITTKLDILLDMMLSGAEHIYRGLDHLAMIVLIAIAAQTWRQALSMASAFTLGHIITLATGLYGIAPAAAWFVPLVELAIAVSIIAAGALIFFRPDQRFGWAGLFIIGLIHGYGFAASASEALFAGQIDALNLSAFALGLEFCQFAIYGLAMPVILLIDRTFPMLQTGWRRSVAFGISGMAITAVVLRTSEASNALGIA